jgi:predicted acylesterase/phospholipase RssA
MPDPRREVRLALVLNGGVSLAIWIGGVTKEIDELRLASEMDPSRLGGGKTSALYAELMTILKQSARVDVIAGASAGGINGILLGAAIFSGRPLPPSLREIWIGLGDFRALLRSPSQRDAPSLMKGDDVVLAQLRRTIGEILAGWSARARPGSDVFLYVTATDLLGRWLNFHDSTGRMFRERDHRRVLSFQYQQPSPAPPAPAAAAAAATEEETSEFSMPLTLDFADERAPELLARSGRATASFPIAFEPHSLPFAGERPTDKPDKRWLVDGGLLDNQPFNPVLDRIAMLPSSIPVRRVLAYVVPYVNEPEQVLAEPAREEDVLPTARQVYGATGSLPRTLPKLESLDRVRREARAQRAAEADRLQVRALEEREELVEAARSLYETYRRTRYNAARQTFEGWRSTSFIPGDGVLAQHPSIDPAEVPRMGPPAEPQVVPVSSLDTPWLSGSFDWDRQKTWRWGLSPAERVASWALLFLRDASRDVTEQERDLIRPARESASALIGKIRRCKQSVQRSFAEITDVEDPIEQGNRAYLANESLFDELQDDFQQLEKLLREVGVDRVPDIRLLLSLEVIRNAFSIESAGVPFPFEFLFMSAGLGNALNHSAASPEQKLAGMKAGHFGGFLKRSWRANDWLWGRLDGVQHVIRATFDLDWTSRLSANDWNELARFAFPQGEQRETLVRLSKERIERAGLPAEDAADAAFVRLLGEAVEHYRAGEQEEALRRFRCCQGAVAARIQLSVLEEDLARVAETAAEDVEAGSSRIAHGVRWAGSFHERGKSSRPGGRRVLDTPERVRLFRELELGEKEKLEDEASSRSTIELAAQTVAVATGVFAGHRGGLPLVVRTALATARGVTLAVSGLVRLLAATPALGAGLLAVVVALVVWGLLAPNTVLGALVPTLAALAIAGGYVLLNFATGALEQSIDNWKRLLGFALLVGVPGAFLLLVGWPGYDPFGTVHDGVRADVVEQVGRVGTKVAAAFAALAVVAAAARVLFELVKPLHWRRRSLALYRLGFVGALFAVGVGFVVTRLRDELGCEAGMPCTAWEKTADERLGTLLFGALVAAALLAAILIELVIPAAVRIRDRKRAGRGTAVTSLPQQKG